MRWYRSAWLSTLAVLLAVATASAQPATDADEARVRALVKTIYTRYNGPIGAMGPLPDYSPSTAAMYKQYDILTENEDISDLSGFDHYCECQDFDEKGSRLLGVTIVRVGPDLIDATARYVLSSEDKGNSTRIRFQKTGTWKIHDVFWTGSGGSLRGTLTETLAEHAIAKPSVGQKSAITQPSVAQTPPTPASVIPVQAGSLCGGNPRCAEVSTFVATVTNLRESATGGSEPYRVVSVTVRFRNLTAGTLFLGYVTGSGVLTDDRGNRYSLGRYHGSVVRGIGELGTSGSIDPKFALRAGESGDARFEFMWFPGKAIIGTRLVADLTVREIESFPGNQWQLGREHALQFRGFGEPAVPAAATVAAAPAVGPATSSMGDVCANKPECFSAGPFLAEITRLNTSRPTNQAHAIQFSVRFRNLTGQPLVLAHTTRSTLIVDDQGNRYTPIWSNIKEVTGMGAASGMQSDPSFVLQPGAAREATFQVQLVVGHTPVRLGNVYNVDFAVEELEVFPGNQVRPARQFAVGFHDMKTKTGGWSALRGLINIEVKTKSP